MIIIDTKKCIGCGLCVKECTAEDIQMVDGTAQIKIAACFKCGHCIAVCPVGAISIDEYDMDEVKNYSEEEFTIDSQQLLNFIKFRRSIRQFKDKEVEVEKLLQIIESGRFTQTGGNMQDVSFIVVKEKLPELKAMTMERLKKMGEEMLADSDPKNRLLRRYAKMWLKMYDEYKKDPEKNDRLFFNAPVVIIVTAYSEVNGALASSNMELMTNTLGLGTVFSGFFVRAALGNEEIRDFLDIKPGRQVVTCMVIGYPDVKYFRTVPRKKADITWI
ncbi:MAG: 4Fe-4S binding protein [Eubacteriaceae bacterium]|nr:4Fe-4S binding protein [Eubacteriaceae bacterium]